MLKWHDDGIMGWQDDGMTWWVEASQTIDRMVYFKTFNTGIQSSLTRSSYHKDKLTHSLLPMVIISGSDHLTTPDQCSVAAPRLSSDCPAPGPIISTNVRKQNICPSYISTILYLKSIFLSELVVSAFIFHQNPMLVFPHDSQKVDKYITFYFKDYYKWTLIQFVRIWCWESIS